MLTGTEATIYSQASEDPPSRLQQLLTVLKFFIIGFPGQFRHIHKSEKKSIKESNVKQDWLRPLNFRGTTQFGLLADLIPVRVARCLRCKT